QNQNRSRRIGLSSHRPHLAVSLTPHLPRPGGRRAGRTAAPSTSPPRSPLPHGIRRRIRSQGPWIVSPLSPLHPRPTEDALATTRRSAPLATPPLRPQSRTHRPHRPTHRRRRPTQPKRYLGHPPPAPRSGGPDSHGSEPRNRR